MTRRPGLAIALALLAACGGRDPLAGRAARLEKLVDAARMERNVEALARVPHRAGTPAQRVAVETAAESLRAAGLEVTISEHTLAIPEAVEASLAVEGPAGRAFDLAERELPGDPYSAAAPADVPFFAWAPDGDVAARVVYANHGAREDYDVLRRAGVAVKGAVVLARAQGVCRSWKSLLAEEA
ncbi:MAG: hypothetical protein ACM369_12565, partial [Acidobacteriota bacterium]